LSDPGQQTLAPHGATESGTSDLHRITNLRAGTTVLRPESGWRPIRFGELWNYRELLWILALRDVRVRYKQTLLGVAWAILQPLLQMLVFVAFFSGYSPPGVKPQLFFFVGLLPWQLFSTSMNNAGNSLIANQGLITKVYFPRLVIPIASVITALLDFLVASLMLIGLMLYFHVAPKPAVLLIPFFVALNFLASMAVGLWLAALNVEYRDVRYVIPFLTQFWLFVTPLIYPYSGVQSPWRRGLLALNPMSGVVEGFRWAILGTEFHPQLLASSVGVIAILLISGLFYFRRMEETFADVV
jgi:lipopolysaccharide transport system permease protein